MAIVVNGEISLPSARQAIALTGKYFTVTNPTIGTPVVGATITAWSATANGMFVIQNRAPSGSGTMIVLDNLFLRMRSTAPTGTLTQQWEAYNETGLVTGTTAVTTRTPVQVNSLYPQTTVAQVQAFAAGAITIPAAAGTRVLQDMCTLTTGLGIDGDTYEITFGADGATGWKNGGAAVRATDTAHIVSGMGPIVIAPQTTTWLNMWWLTQAANVPSWEYRLGYYETQV